MHTGFSIYVERSPPSIQEGFKLELKPLSSETYVTGLYWILNHFFAIHMYHRVTTTHIYTGQVIRILLPRKSHRISIIIIPLNTNIFIYGYAN